MSINSYAFHELQVTQPIAGDADNRSTKPYDGRGQRVLPEDMERIGY
jgi:hypothetical protein